MKKKFTLFFKGKSKYRFQNKILKFLGKKYKIFNILTPNEYRKLKKKLINKKLN
jgi:hypothetical protein